MLGKIIRKILVVLIIIVPAVSYSGCKKQPKCGCGNDVIDTLKDTPAYVYFDPSGSSISFQVSGNPYDTYHFCNPQEMFPKLKDYKSGDLLLVSGHAYWDCSYIYQQSNYSYGSSLYKVLVVQVTDVYQDLYGKK